MNFAEAGGHTVHIHDGRAREREGEREREREVQSDGSVPVECAKHRDDGATLNLSNERSGETAEAAAGRLAAAAESGRLAASTSMQAEVVRAASDWQDNRESRVPVGPDEPLRSSLCGRNMITIPTRSAPPA